MAPYPGALTLNFRQLVPGKPPYSGAWPLNFRGCCPESSPKWSLILGAKNFYQDLHEVSAAVCREPYPRFHWLPRRHATPELCLPPISRRIVSPDTCRADLMFKVLQKADDDVRKAPQEYSEYYQ